MKQNIRKNIETGVLIGLICAVMLSFSHFNAACDDLKSSVLRLHVIANSDSDADQDLKLKVRDEILSQAGYIFEDCSSLESAEAVAEREIEHINKIAVSAVRQNGYDYDVSCEIGESLFDTREYDSFTLPAGKYRSLIVKIGKAEGKNWWCVVFPAVCIPAAAGAKLSDSASEESSQIAENSSRYIMRFKAVEWYEELKQKLNKN